MRLIGEDGVAAYGVIMYVNFVFVAIFIGYAIGSAPLVGYNYGAENYDELKKRADASAAEKEAYEAQLLQAFKDKKLKSKSLIKEAQALKKIEDKKLKAAAEKVTKNKNIV